MKRNPFVTIFRAHPFGGDVGAERNRTSWIEVVRSPRIGICLILLLLTPVHRVGADNARLSDDRQSIAVKGKKLYSQLCSDCHGSDGAGVEGAYETSLTGVLTPAELKDYIAETMPEDDPESCTGEDAEAVAQYIYAEFYSIEAQNRRNPPKTLFSRLTNQQYRNSLADLLSESFDRREESPKELGLSAVYYASRNQSRRAQKKKQTDPQIDFQFDGGAPPGIDGKEFSVVWSGSLIADHTGEHEIIIRSANGVRLRFNGGRKALIDANVVSGDASEYRAKTYLLAGRSYDIQVVWSRHKQKNAFINLAWIEPGQKKRTIPPQNFTPKRSRILFQPTVEFPADDESYGYARGISVSREWMDAQSRSAIEAAQTVARFLPVFTGNPPPPQQRAKARDFCHAFARRAFRGSLNDHQKNQYVDRLFDQSDLSTKDAVKRSIALILKSPYFLYPSIQSGKERPAAILALTFWDSIPNQSLLDTEAGGFLDGHAKNDWRLERLTRDHRTRIKVRQFFDHWLRINELKHFPKSESYPSFDADLVDDLHASLYRLIDHLIWEKDAPFGDFFLTSQWVVNRKIAKFYGVEFPKDSKTDFVLLERSEKQKGIHSHPLLMSGFAYPDGSSPIHRGVFVATSLLGRRLNPPPDTFPPFKGEIAKNWTTREKVEHQTKPVSCQRCHGLINSLGFTLENYDPVGRLRTTDNGKPVDAKGRVRLENGESESLMGNSGLGDFLAESREVKEHFVEEFFQFMVKQPLAAYGPESKKRLMAYFAENKYSIKRLLVEIGKIAARPVGDGQAADQSHAWKQSGAFEISNAWKNSHSVPKSYSLVNHHE